jgi:hypothetical protein
LIKKGREPCLAASAVVAERCTGVGQRLTPLSICPSRWLQSNKKITDGVAAAIHYDFINLAVVALL